MSGETSGMFECPLWDKSRYKILALPADYRRIAFSKEGALPWRSDFECAVRRGKAG